MLNYIFKKHTTVFLIRVVPAVVVVITFLTLFYTFVIAAKLVLRAWCCVATLFIRLIAAVEIAVTFLGGRNAEPRPARVVLGQARTVICEHVKNNLNYVWYFFIIAVIYVCSLLWQSGSLNERNLQHPSSSDLSLQSSILSQRWCVGMQYVWFQTYSPHANCSASHSGGAEKYITFS